MRLNNKGITAARSKTFYPERWISWIHKKKWRGARSMESQLWQALSTEASKDWSCTNERKQRCHFACSAYIIIHLSNYRSTVTSKILDFSAWKFFAVSSFARMSTISFEEVSFRGVSVTVHRCSTPCVYASSVPSGGQLHLMASHQIKLIFQGTTVELEEVRSIGELRELLEARRNLLKLSSSIV